MRNEIISDTYLLGTCVQWIGCSSDTDITRFGPGRRNYTIIHYCTKGRGYYNGNIINMGYGFIIRPGDFEEYHPDKDDPWSFLWIVLDTKEYESILSLYKEDPVTHIFAYDFAQELRSIERELKNIRHKFSRGTYNMQLFLRILEYHFPAQSAQNKTSAAEEYTLLAKQYIHLHYFGKITVEEIAASMGVSTSYLYRVFRARTGLSPKQYLNDYRLHIAKQYLTCEKMTVSEVGRAVGYDDVLEFSRFFKSQCGISPAAYAKQAH